MFLPAAPLGLFDKKLFAGYLLLSTAHLKVFGFSNELERLAIPPRRMANIIRVLLEGLLIELAQAHTEEELKNVDQCYADMRALFARFVLVEQEALPDNPADGFPLPW